MDSFNQNRVIEIPNFSKSRYHLLFFPDTEALIVAPISTGDRKYGTIEVRFLHSTDITEQAASAMKLLGRQLGLYLFLGEKIERLREGNRTPLDSEDSA